MAKVALDEEFIYEGKIYGPGTIDVKETRIADGLKAANERVRASRGTQSPVKPNGIMTSITGDREAMPPANGLTPDDLAKQKETADAAAQQQARTEQIARLRNQEPLNPNKVIPQPAPAAETGDEK